MITFAGMSLPVTDLGRSVPFYESLGFTTEVCNGRFVLLRLDSGTLGLLELGAVVAREAANLRQFVQVELLADDLDELYRDLLARGVSVPNPPRDRGFERQLQLRDPDGFTVEFADRSARGLRSTPVGPGR
ncbi:VOC family protein [Amycolatopsis kentuckyensis]|uniref:VOC family protein n=1 Tax=Amycolatopsis kentuckyensis TaxID=218823 RepID=UPI003563B67B